MANINSRVFGSDIPIIIKKKLEARQLAASGKIDPNAEINPSRYPDDRTSYYTYNELLGGPQRRFTGEGDLSSRTPFTRMWTAVNLIKKVEKKNKIYTIEKYDGDIDIRTEVMKKMKAEQVQSALVFFWTFAKELLIALPSFLTKKLKETRMQLQAKVLQKNGVGSG